MSRRDLYRSFVAAVKKQAAKTPVDGFRGQIGQRTSEGHVLKLYRALLLKVHPDHGGLKDDFQVLHSAKSAWDKSEPKQGVRRGGEGQEGGAMPQPDKPREANANDTSADVRGEPCVSSMDIVEDQLATRDELDIADHDSEAEDDIDAQVACRFCPCRSDSFRIQSWAVMLTYNGVATNESWERFQKHVKAKLKTWHVLYYGATMEECKDGNCHFHLMLQFRQKIDFASGVFAFEDRLPNCSVNRVDYCGQKTGTKNAQVSYDRGFFYVWADKIGTCVGEDGVPCRWGNYGPVWTKLRMTYQVLGLWPEKLWKCRKLTHEKYLEYLQLSRDGIPARRRNYQEVLEAERQRADDLEMERTVKRIHANPVLHTPFRKFIEIDAWWQAFSEDQKRYPMLIIVAASFMGKTEFAVSLFKSPLLIEIGKLEHFPNSLRAYDRRVHDGIVVDDVRDMKFVTDHQHVFQSKYSKRTEFASSPCGTQAFNLYLFKTPWVVTANMSTKNLHFLETNDFLSKASNRTLLRLTESPFVGAAPNVAPVMRSRSEQMARWNVGGTSSFLDSRDLLGASRICANNDVTGIDMLNMTQQSLTEEIGVSPFAARKILAARDSFLAEG